MENKELIEKINKLKKEKNAVILVHNYQGPEIYEVADFLGDSLELAKKAKQTDADIILFCGVDFMAEAAKIINPNKIVLHPDKLASCPMANMLSPELILKEKEKHPDAAVVSYINTTAAIKAVSDICCTSANSIKVVNSLKQDEIIFTPDRNLGAYTQTKTDKKIMPLQGYCYVHENISVDEIKKAKELHPKAEVIVHPECKPEVIELADGVCSTSQMISHVKNSPAKEFIIGTEFGMLHRLELECPDKKYYTTPKICVGMKKITLEKVYDCLKDESPEVNINPDIMEKARKALEAMLNIP